MKKKIVRTTVIILLLTVTAVFMYLFVSANEEKKFLKANIDQQFAFSLQQLHGHLHRSAPDDMDADALAQYHYSLTKNSAVCESLFNMSSYADNNALQNIMWTLAQMTPPNAYYLKITDKELIDDISYLILRLKYQNAEGLANEAWNKLSQQLKRTD